MPKNRDDKFLARCEACEQQPVTVVETMGCGNNPFLLCAPCHDRMQRLSLRPAEWYRLAQIHGPWGEMLGPEYYTDGGVAVQPADELEETPDLLPAPVLKDVSHDIVKLWVHTLTRRRLRPQLLAAWRQHPKAAVAEYLAKMWEARSDAHARKLVLGICRHCLGSAGAKLVKTAWEDYALRQAQALSGGAENEDTDEDEDADEDEDFDEDDEDAELDDSVEVMNDLLEGLDQGACWESDSAGVAMSDLAAASAQCLDEDDGYDRVVAEIEKYQPDQWVGRVHYLMPFRSERALAWIESHVQVPVVTRSQWGKTAAVSRLSWAKVVEWLEQGRPMSHVAVDALSSLIYHCGDPLDDAYGCRLIDPPSRATVIEVLSQCMERDPVPRVEKEVSFVLDNLEVLLDGKPFE